jgi:hypothetical protein
MPIIRQQTGNTSARNAMQELCDIIAKFGIAVALLGAPAEVIAATTALVAACNATGYGKIPKV